jgi:hypothetical protein
MNSTVAQKPAIFTTSEIQNRYDEHLPEVFGYPDGEKFYSTGALEEACMLEGMVVLVASTRSKPGEHDAWWIRLVERSGGRVFWGPVDPFDLEADSGVGWRELYRHLRLPWPISIIGDAHWTDARHALIDRGYRLGHTFNSRKRQNQDRLDLINDFVSA